MRATHLSISELSRALHIDERRLTRLVESRGLEPVAVNDLGESLYSGHLLRPLAAESQTASLIRSTLFHSLLPQSDQWSASIETALVALPELARSLIGADYAAVTLLDESGRVEKMYYAGMTDGDVERIGSPPVGSGILGLLPREDAALRLANITDDPRAEGFPDGHPPMGPLMGMQVANDNGRRANLYVANSTGGRKFTAHDEERIYALANYATLALNNAQLFEAETKLRDRAESAERRLEAVIRESSAGVLVVDAESRKIAYASSEARRLIGLDLNPGDTLDSVVADVTYLRRDGSVFPISELPLQRALEEKVGTGPVELTFVHKDGRKLPALVSAAPIFNSAGAMDTAVAVFMDTTRLKQLDQVRDDFFSMVTHDLRTPLATIKGLTDAAVTASGGAEHDEVNGYLDSIDEEVHYLTELVSNLLDMSRIEAGADVFEFEICNMADITQDVVGRALRSREGKGRQVNVNVPADLPLLYADPAQVGRVMANLLSNALKYSDGVVEVRAEIEEATGRVRTEIADEGPGIPDEFKPVVFDKFARLKSMHSRGREGSGLGLAICKSIVEAHNGELGVDSDKGKGSRFWFSLPVETR